MDPLPRIVTAPLSEAAGAAALPWRGSLHRAVLGAYPDQQGINERCREEVCHEKDDVAVDCHHVPCDTPDDIRCLRRTRSQDTPHPLQLYMRGFGIPGTEAFVGPGEPATLSGDVVISSTGVLTIKVFGATPFETFTVLVGNFVTGPTLLPVTLTTDSAGDGKAINKLPPGTYISEVFLLRDTNANGLLEPRILAGFVIP